MLSIIIAFYVYMTYTMNRRVAPKILTNITESDSLILQKEFGINLQENSEIIMAQKYPDCISIQIQADITNWENFITNTLGLNPTVEENKSFLNDITDDSNYYEEYKSIDGYEYNVKSIYNYNYAHDKMFDATMNTYIYKGKNAHDVNQYYVEITKNTLYNNEEIFNLNWEKERKS